MHDFQPFGLSQSARVTHKTFVKCVASVLHLFFDLQHVYLHVSLETRGYLEHNHIRKREHATHCHKQIHLRFHVKENAYLRSTHSAAKLVHHKRILLCFMRHRGQLFSLYIALTLMSYAQGIQAILRFVLSNFINPCMNIHKRADVPVS